jgi:hypothetical protein
MTWSQPFIALLLRFAERASEIEDVWYTGAAGVVEHQPKYQAPRV